MHNGFVRVEEEKMSKSLGNFFTVREVTEKYPPESVRYFILTSHYRSPLNYADQQLDAAQAALERLYLSLRGLTPSTEEPDPGYLQRFREAMDDDFNTPEALAVLFDLARDLNRAREQGSSEVPRLAATLRHLGAVLGLLQADPEQFLKARPGAAGDAEAVAIDALVAARDTARAGKNWAEADRIRDELAAKGIVLEDGPNGTSWRRS